MHPSIKILIYFTVLLTMGLMTQQFFLVFFSVAIALVFILQKQKFLSRCLRLRWLFLSIFIVCAFGTPGEYISNLAWDYLPTKEGIYSGFMQVAKLLLALSLLGILFHQTKPAVLMLGLHTLLHPLNWLKIDASRFIARLMLTLEYVDQFTLVTLNRKNFLDLFNQVQQENASQGFQNIHLSAMSFKYVDVFAVLLTIFYVWFVMAGVQR